MITRLNLSNIAHQYPYKYRAFSEAYEKFDDKYSSTGELGEMARSVANAVSGGKILVGGDLAEYDAMVDATREIVDAFSIDGIKVYPVVLDSETQFELFFGVNDVTKELIDLLGPDGITEEYEENDDIYVGY